jgi:hypothetical protein
LRTLAADGVLATFVTADLELGYSARNPGQPVDWVARRGSVTVAARLGPY